MGWITGTLCIVVGLFFLIFPNIAMKIYRIGSSRGGIAIEKEKGKIKVGMSPTVEKALGERRAKIFFRLLGAAFLLSAIIAYLSPNAP